MGVARKGNTKQKEIMSANLEMVRGAGEEKKGAVPKQSSREKDARRVVARLTCLLSGYPVG